MACLNSVEHGFTYYDIVVNFTYYHDIFISFLGSDRKRAGLIGVHSLFCVVDLYVNVLVFFEQDGECFSIVKLVGKWLFLMN